MTDKPEPPLFLDMAFGEALTRYVGTKPEEVEAPPGRKRKAAKLSPGGQCVDPKPDRKRQSG